MEQLKTKLHETRVALFELRNEKIILEKSDMLVDEFMEKSSELLKLLDKELKKKKGEVKCD